MVQSLGPAEQPARRPADRREGEEPAQSGRAPGTARQGKEGVGTVTCQQGSHH